MAMLSFCGIDVSKDRLDVVVLPEQQYSSVRNDAAGGTELIAQLRGFSIAAIGQGNKEKVVSCGMIRVARAREGRAEHGMRSCNVFL
jgi:transposase